jgi:hypothetical protein
MISTEASYGKRLCEDVEGRSHAPCLVPEKELQKFIERLRVGEVRAIATRLMIVAIAAAELLQDSLEGRFEDSNLILIRRLAGERGNRSYRRLMRRVVDALEQRRQGFNLIYLTATRALCLIHQSLPEYKTIRQLYEADIKQIRGMNASSEDWNNAIFQD